MQPRAIPVVGWHCVEDSRRPARAMLRQPPTRGGPHRTGRRVLCPTRRPRCHSSLRGSRHGPRTAGVRRTPRGQASVFGERSRVARARV